MSSSLRIFVDGKAFDADNIVARTIGDVVRHLETVPALRRRMIESIVIGGIEFHDLVTNRSVELPSGSDIHVRTQTVEELLAATMQSARDYLPKLEAGCTQVATLLHEGRAREALALVAQLVEGLQWYSEVLGNMAALIPGEERNATERLTALEGILQQLMQSLEGQDHTLAADILEYELSPELQQGFEYVDSLSQFRFFDRGNCT